ncbi:MAG TPA: response regulator transcription factor [Kiritimatiellia bacterium]|nr:response regulator transcription factor [Kiritimatiellia bacterium]
MVTYNDSDILAQLDAPLIILSHNQAWAAEMKELISSTLGNDLPISILRGEKDLSVKRISSAVTIIDLSLISGDPLNWLKLFIERFSANRIILVSDTTNAVLAERLIRAGASAMVLHRDIRHGIPRSLQAIARNERYLSEEIMQELLHGMAEAPGKSSSLPLERLSDREVVIFRQLGLGRSLTDIARELNLNVKTVSTHCKNIRSKLNITSNRHLAEAGGEWLASMQTATYRKA